MKPDEINTTFEDPECRDLFIREYKRLCEGDRKLGQLRLPSRIKPTGDQRGGIDGKCCSNSKAA